MRIKIPAVVTLCLFAAATEGNPSRMTTKKTHGNKSRQPLCQTRSASQASSRLVP